MDVPLGSTLGDVFTINFFNGHRSFGPRTVWADRVRLAIHFARGLRPRRASGEETCPSRERRVLATLLDDDARFRDLVLPVVEGLGPENCNVFVRRTRGSAAELSEFHCFTSTALRPYFDAEAWRRAFLSCYPKWRRRLRSVLDGHDLPRFVAPHLLDAMIHSSQHVAAYHRLLEDLNPAVIVSDFDRNAKFSGLVLAARSRGIPTVTLLHGVINPPYGYVPLLADVACCWGELSRQQLIDMGTDPERLVVTGYHRGVQGADTDRREARRRVGVSDDRPLVVWISNPIAPQMRKIQARTFCQALSAREEVVPMIRLHPSEDLETYAEELREFPRVQINRAASATVKDILSAADLIVSHNSGLGNDALVAGKPVVVLDAIDAPLGNAAPLIERAGCPRVQSARELEQVVLRVLEDEGWRQELAARAREFVQYQFAALGDEALAKVLGVIRERGNLAP